jgi:very-short-patch-repair endonuclease
MPLIGGKPCSPSSDGLIAEVAAGQHGVVARYQLTEIAVRKRAIEQRLARGRLHRVRRGVYAVGHKSLTAKSRWMAAVLACGSGAVLSYRSAAALWGLRAAARRDIEITAARGRQRQPGIELHCDRLEADETTVRHGIPVTTIARTVLDLAAVLDRHRLERAFNEAEMIEPGALLTLGQLLTRHPRRHGAAALRRLLDAGFSGITRSELEDLFIRFLDNASLPAPDLNFPMQLGGHWIEADCVWREQRVIVELDGHRTHGTRAAFERDRRRDRALQAKGWRVIRVTWRQLQDEPEVLAADLRALLVQPARDSGSSRSRKTPGSTLRAVSAPSSAS